MMPHKPEKRSSYPERMKYHKLSHVTLRCESLHTVSNELHLYFSVICMPSKHPKGIYIMRHNVMTRTGWISWLHKRLRLRQYISGGRLTSCPRWQLQPHKISEIRVCTSSSLYSLQIPVWAFCTARLIAAHQRRHGRRQPEICLPEFCKAGHRGQAHSTQWNVAPSRPRPCSGTAIASWFPWLKKPFTHEMFPQAWDHLLEHTSLSLDAANQGSQYWARKHTALIERSTFQLCKTGFSTLHGRYSRSTYRSGPN